MNTDHESVIRDYWERIWLDRDLDALDELVTDPSIRHTDDGTSTLSVDQLRVRLTDALRAVRGETVDLDDITVDGDRAWVRLTLRGISLATMSPMAITWLAHYRFEAGRMAETWALHKSGLDWRSH